MDKFLKPYLTRMALFFVTMRDEIHIHDDDLELYNSGRLEPERILALELHLSVCHECRERLRQCIGPQLEDVRKNYS